MRPPALHSYLLWRSSVDPDARTLAKWRFTAAASLIPAAMVGLFVFGWYAGLLIGLSLVSAFAADLVCHRLIFQGPAGTSDGTWLLTGLLIGLFLPPTAPWWLAVLVSAAAVVIGKHWLSVDGVPLLQPAAVGLLLLHVVFVPFMHPTAQVAGQQVPKWPVLAWPFEAPRPEVKENLGRHLVGQFLRRDITHCIDRQTYSDQQFAGQQPMFDPEKGVQADAVFGPRPLDLAHENPKRGISDLPGRDHYEWQDVILGWTPGPIGGASGLALIFGICLLLFTRAVSWLTPLIGLAVLCAGLTVLGNQNVAIHLLSGPTLLGFFYLAADPGCAPRSRRGKILSGVSVGLLELILRGVLVEATFISGVAVQGLAIVFDQYIAPPKEAPRQTPTRMSITTLGRL
jgi:electron transport complex protein RnfD